MDSNNTTTNTANTAAKIIATEATLVGDPPRKARCYYRKLTRWGVVWYIPNHPDASGKLVVLPE